MDFQTILFEVRNQIAFVTFNRPESMNAVNRQMARELVDAFRQIEGDAGIRIAFFTGAERRLFPPAWISKSGQTLFSPIERRQQKLSATARDQTQRSRAQLLSRPSRRSAVTASAADSSSPWPATCAWRRGRKTQTC
jgi:enoyl-CoA hydratase/carnithine racemase